MSIPSDYRTGHLEFSEPRAHDYVRPRQLQAHAQPRTAVTARKPNVIVFFTDQQRHDTTGVQGNPMNLTPNFDRLARAGTHIYTL